MLLSWQIYFDILSGPQNFEILAILRLLFEGVPTTVLHTYIRNQVDK